MHPFDAILFSIKQTFKRISTVKWQKAEQYQSFKQHEFCLFCFRTEKDKGVEHDLSSNKSLFNGNVSCKHTSKSLFNGTLSCKHTSHQVNLSVKCIP